MKPHRTDGVSLSFGLIFLLVALWWALSRVVTIHLPAVGWLVAGGLIMFGVVGLFGAIRSGRAPAPQPATVAQPAVTEPEIPGDLPPEVHASIVRELLEEPSERFRKDQDEAEKDKPQQD
ncbi:phage holin family protein [Actinoplanes sp. NPDC051513]|uniref:phage holin family protein n=1 Tax=Actinoplanes sp. NPDC051513 TaxID=3363908 RepID=UPI0037AB48AB